MCCADNVIDYVASTTGCDVTKKVLLSVAPAIYINSQRQMKNISHDVNGLNGMKY